MNRNAAWLLGELDAEAQEVLAALAASPDHPLRLNDLVADTGLPPGHVGRHLRTLERERLARYAAGAWAATDRGTRHAVPAAA